MEDHREDTSPVASQPATGDFIADADVLTEIPDLGWLGHDIEIRILEHFDRTIGPLREAL